MGEHGDKLQPEDKGRIEEKLAALKNLIQDTGASKEQLEAATKELSEASMKLGEIVYQQAQQEQQAGENQADASGDAGSSEGNKADDDVVDAEFEDMDDKEKK